MNQRNTLVLILLISGFALLKAQDATQNIIDVEKQSYLNQQHPNLRTSPNQHQFDIQFYELNLNVFPATNYLYGAVIVKGNSLVNSLDHVDIDLFSNMTVDSVIQNSSHLSFQRVGEQIHIYFPNLIDRGAAFSLEIFYRGNPQDIGFGSFNWRDYQGTPRIWTLSEPYGAPAWWPCKDDPADKADSVYINITVPDTIVAVSNGILTVITPAANSRHTYHWETHYQISTYLVFIAAADYVQFNDWYISASGDSMPLNFYVYPELLTAAQEDFGITKEMIGAFALRFGEYPFINEKYGMASVMSGASMEHQTLTTLNRTYISGIHLGDWVVAHELAHQWFGDCITMKNWHHVWLNEGFATYSEALWQEHLNGSAAYQQYMAGKDLGYFTGTVYVEDTTDISAIFSRTVYNKGAWVLHMLRGVLGDSLFLKALRNYAMSPSLIYVNAITKDFQTICETTSNRDLDWFFNQWIYKPGRPVYRYYWETEGNSSPYVSVLKIDQFNLQPDYNNLPYKMPLQVRLSGLNLEQTLTVWDSLASQQFEFITEVLPTNLEIDPDNWVLRKLEKVEEGEFVGIPTKFKLSQNYPNPFNASTTIIYGVPVPGEVKIEIYNILGSRVFDGIVSERMIAFHRFTWDGKDNHGNDLPSGIYFYRFSQGQNAIVRKMILVR